MFHGIIPSVRAKDDASTLGCRQAVRHQTLTLTCVGSNPAIPAKYDPLAQSVEQLPFKQWVWSSNLQRVTKKEISPRGYLFFDTRGDSKNSMEQSGGLFLGIGSTMPTEKAATELAYFQTGNHKKAVKRFNQADGLNLCGFLCSNKHTLTNPRHLDNLPIGLPCSKSYNANSICSCVNFFGLPSLKFGSWRAMAFPVWVSHYNGSPLILRKNLSIINYQAKSFTFNPISKAAGLTESLPLAQSLVVSGNTPAAACRNPLTARR